MATPWSCLRDLAGLRELVGKCEAVNEADCVSATWTAFAEKLAAAKAIVETTARTAATAAQAEAARADLLKAYADLRYKGRTQRLGELCASFEPVYQESQYTKESFNVYQNALNAAKAQLPPTTAATTSWSSSGLRWRMPFAVWLCIPK